MIKGVLFSHEWHQRHVTRRKFSVQRRNANIINNRYLLLRYSGPNEAPGCSHCSCDYYLITITKAKTQLTELNRIKQK